METPKRHELFSTNVLKLDLLFYPPSVNSAFHFIARIRRSANGIQPNFAKRRMVGRANKVPQKGWGYPSRQKLGAKELLHLFGF